MARKPNPDTVDRVVELSPEQMLTYRQAALAFACGCKCGSPAETLHVAGTFLMFLMQGEPVYALEESVQQRALPSESPAPVVMQVYIPPDNPAGRPLVQRNPPAPKAPVVTAPTPVASSTVSPTLPASTTTSQVPPPVAIKQVADKLVALVQDKARGGRAAAEALLKKYGVSQLAQIPGAKLADFAKECETFALAVPGDPTGGLLG